MDNPSLDTPMKYDLSKPVTVRTGWGAEDQRSKFRWGGGSGCAETGDS